MNQLLAVQDFSLKLKTQRGDVQPLKDISLSIDAGESVGLVGESGCGKSVLAMSVMQLLKNAQPMSGEINFRGTNLLTLPEARMREVRGRQISMIFQDSMSSLNPVMTIASQMTESLRQIGLKQSVAMTQAKNLLDLCGLQDVERVLRSYPHELSGGMRQRVMIAIALSQKPQLILADEPTTALDVTVQAQVLGLLKKIQRDMKLGLLFVSHDLLVIEKMCSRLYVMYAGQIIETGKTQDVLKNPQHPYTKALIACKPKLGEKKIDLTGIPGSVPSLQDLPKFCRFAPRCTYRFDRCDKAEPQLKQKNASFVRCFYAQEKQP